MELTHYFELRAVPQIETTQVEIVNQLMQSMHLVLINYQGSIAITYPCYTQQKNKTLGGIIRVHGPKLELEAFNHALTAQSIVRDYALITPIKPVPSTIKGYVRLIRVSPKGQSALRRAEKRLKAQGKWSLEVKNRLLEKWGSVHLEYPHLNLKSQSTGQRFNLWLKQEYQNHSVEGKFNSYGLSQTATVPLF